MLKKSQPNFSRPRAEMNNNKSLKHLASHGVAEVETSNSICKILERYFERYFVKIVLKVQLYDVYLASKKWIFCSNWDDWITISAEIVLQSSIFSPSACCLVIAPDRWEELNVKHEKTVAIINTRVSLGGDLLAQHIDMTWH